MPLPRLRAPPPDSPGSTPSTVSSEPRREYSAKLRLYYSTELWLDYSSKRDSSEVKLERRGSGSMSRFLAPSLVATPGLGASPKQQTRSVSGRPPTNQSVYSAKLRLDYSAELWLDCSSRLYFWKVKWNDGAVSSCHGFRLRRGWPRRPRGEPQRQTRSV